MTKVNFTTETKHNCNPSINPSSQEKTEIPSVLDLTDTISKRINQTCALLYLCGDNIGDCGIEMASNALWGIGELLEDLSTYTHKWSEQWRETRNSVITA